MPHSREIIIFTQAYLPEGTLTSEVRSRLIRFCADELKLLNTKVNVTTRIAVEQSKCSPRKYTKPSPHGLRNLRSVK